MMQLSNYIVPPPQPTPTVTPTSALTDTPTPGDTPTPSDTPVPSDTPMPSDTPTSSSTPTQAPPVIDTYAYDPNGNMIERNEAGVEWTQGFNAENRLASLSSAGGNWDFTYDGDGNRVKQVHDGVMTLYLAGGSYEVRDAAGDEEAFKYYGVAGQRIAMRSDGTTKFLLADHLGSVVSVLDDSGLQIEGGEQRYMPYGEPRFAGGITATDFGFTGQRVLEGTGLMDYNARFYDAVLGKFTQPDTLGISFANPQSWNRFAYAENNPINFADPSGHYVACPPGGCTGGGGGGVCYYCNYGRPKTPPPPKVVPGQNPKPPKDPREPRPGGQTSTPTPTIAPIPTPQPSETPVPVVRDPIELDLSIDSYDQDDLDQAYCGAFMSMNGFGSSPANCYLSQHQRFDPAKVDWFDAGVDLVGGLIPELPISAKDIRAADRVWGFISVVFAGDEAIRENWTQESTREFVTSFLTFTPIGQAVDIAGFFEELGAGLYYIE